MKYNVGDKVRIKTFGELADGNEISCNGTIDKGVGFTKLMREMCGKEVTIGVVGEMGYLLEEDTNLFPFTYEDWMIEDGYWLGDVKVGDEVEIINNISGHGFKIGEIVTIKEICSTDYFCNNGFRSWYVLASDMKLIKAPQEFKFKTGDVVKIVGQFANHGFELGEVVEVTHLPNRKSRQQWYFCKSLSRGIHYYVDERDMEYDENLISMDKEKIARKVLDEMFVDGLYSVTIDIEDDFDVVDKPRHYADKKIEVISYIQDTVDFLKVVGYEAYCIGNVIKYVSRYTHKNGVEDLKKARYYLQEVIDILEVN